MKHTRLFAALGLFCGASLLGGCVGSSSSSSSLDLVNIRNRGAAFGFLNRSDIEWQFWLFLLATLAAVTAIILLVRSSPEQPWLFRALGLVMGGALGNLVDRLRFRAVVDFLDIYVGDWHWPAFNVADMAICAGAGLACILLWRQPHARQGKDAS